MGIGTSIRHRLGHLEVPAANLYRSCFINLDDLADLVASTVDARQILEIGCGDGSFADRLVARFPAATYLGIDIADTPGRLFQGDPKRAKFRSMSTTELRAEDQGLFDLVVIIDVVHHVPTHARHDLLRDAAALTRLGGLLVVKDWARGRNAAHAFAYVADRYISGDKGVAFPALTELREILSRSLIGFDNVIEARIPPRRNNVLFARRRVEPPDPVTPARPQSVGTLTASP